MLANVYIKLAETLIFKGFSQQMRQFLNNCPFYPISKGAISEKQGRVSYEEVVPIWENQVEVLLHFDPPFL
ncbi:hypothetical protein [Aerosakkonema funiforme]|uniref:hypothetical protein n=1 Tax=Aerosakkonema funiforme TaxID=1246630 RepID=UPI001686AC66|nr:hypothetical protein [Aerosakkonema funiforme]